MAPRCRFRIQQTKDIDGLPVVFCDADRAPGEWKRVLAELSSLPRPPMVIVVSRLADNRLWSEALNLGAWDVLAKPFDRMEVFRSVRAGWQHQHDQLQMYTAAAKVMRTAS